MGVFGLYIIFFFVTQFLCKHCYRTTRCSHIDIIDMQNMYLGMYHGRARI